MVEIGARWMKSNRLATPDCEEDGVQQGFAATLPTAIGRWLSGPQIRAAILPTPPPVNGSRAFFPDGFSAVIDRAPQIVSAPQKTRRACLFKAARASLPLPHLP
ncbi:predicted protein [Chaetomium globosum CBS 148.51]|uniref:Uncharacterized protein n=1 Tax=Chaetomium globosum (strain ATCC 6205 / CBS 148.51 / DSM 1962 / NBRC 6347 / NRRL 1970) TaxID=306901 RepID=Q2HA28_CHAGB|nr:uncharacterized protein CHGG_02926 [Chaetomium globosum CBS 148.51]EAQ90991.1 predicted protein [Chaetomium globosum CBS 148.51]